MNLYDSFLPSGTISKLVYFCKGITKFSAAPLKYVEGLGVYVSLTKSKSFHKINLGNSGPFVLIPMHMVIDTYM